MKRQDVSGEETLHTDATGGGGSNVNITGINGTAPSTGLGASDAGTLRVAISSDSPSTGNTAASATGAAVPANADYTGLNVGGTLRGATAVNPSGSIFAQQVDLASVAGTTTATGNGVVSAGVQRVAIASDNTAFAVNATLQAGAAVIGHVITDTGSTTVVTGNVTAVQGTGSNLHTVVDSGTITTVSTVTAVSDAQVQGKAASGAAKSGNPVQCGAVFNTTQPTVTNGQAVENQATARGAQIVATGADTFNVTVNAALPAGTALLGKVGIDQTTPGTTNAVSVAQIGANTVLTGNGVTGTGSQRVTIASDNTAFSVNATLAAGTALIGQVAASNETATVYNGTTALTPKFATITASASGATQIVAAVGGKRIRVLRMSLMANGTVNVKWQSHVTPTDLTGLYYLVANTGWVEGYCPVGVFQTVSGEALDINLSANVAVGGSLVYVEV